MRLDKPRIAPLVDSESTTNSARCSAGSAGTSTAYATLFLCADEAKFVTGVILPVNGGIGARIG